MRYGFLHLCVAATLLTPSIAQSRTAKVEPKGEVAACVKRGIAYFKEIGSYPTLKAKPNRGRDAEVVALERCRRTTSAF